MSGHKDFKINQNFVGEHHPTYIIAEVGQAHDGSLGMAHAFIDAIAKTGANAIKFQTHFADAESSTKDEFRVNIFPQDETRYGYWKRIEFTEGEWGGLAKHCHSVGLDFLSSAFSFKAIELLEKIGVGAWKIASGEVNNFPALKMMCDTGKPILLSSGMSTWKELDEAVAFVKKTASDLCVFQCTTSYPCPPENIGLNLIGEMKRKYKVPVGLSDHSGSIFPSLASVMIGGRLVECHVTMSRHAFGPDVSASLTIEEILEMVKGIRMLEKMLAVSVDKDEQANKFLELKRMFGKGIYAEKTIRKGQFFTADNLALKKPAGELEPNNFFEIFGKKSTSDIMKGEEIKKSDIENEK
jgi:N-acetylneuraminate synthase